MHASSRTAEILEQIRTSRQQFEDALARVELARMTEPGVNGEWSVKDVLVHIAWWEQHLLRRLRTGQDDLYVEGVDGRETTDRANAEVYAANHERPLADARAEYDASYQETLATIEAMPVDELANDEVYQAIGADTFHHYPEHTAMLNRWLDSDTSAGI
jgi:hypothetical protein